MSRPRYAAVLIGKIHFSLILSSKWAKTKKHTQTGQGKRGKQAQSEATHSLQEKEIVWRVCGSKLGLIIFSFLFNEYKTCYNINLGHVLDSVLEGHPYSWGIRKECVDQCGGWARRIRRILFNATFSSLAFSSHVSRERAILTSPAFLWYTSCDLYAVDNWLNPRYPHQCTIPRKFSPWRFWSCFLLFHRERIQLY